MVRYIQLSSISKRIKYIHTFYSTKVIRNWVENSTCKFKKKKELQNIFYKAREMAQWVGKHTVLPEDLSSVSVPTTSISQMPVTPTPGDPSP